MLLTAPMLSAKNSVMGVIACKLRLNRGWEVYHLGILSNRLNLAYS